MVLARDWGMTDLEERLATAIEASFEPTWDRTRGEFTWGMGLNEEHPRGQFNAFLAAGEAAAFRSWERLSAAPLEPCPQIVGVEVAEMALARAEWVDGSLHLKLAARREDSNQRTSFQLVGAESGNWEVAGSDDVSLDPTPTGLGIRVPMVNTEFTLVRSRG